MNIQRTVEYHNQTEKIGRKTTPTKGGKAGEFACRSFTGYRFGRGAPAGATGEDNGTRRVVNLRNLKENR